MNKKSLIKTIVITGVIISMLSTVVLCSDKGKGSISVLSISNTQEK